MTQFSLGKNNLPLLHNAVQANRLWRLWWNLWLVTIVQIKTWLYYLRVAATTNLLGAITATTNLLGAITHERTPIGWRYVFNFLIPIKVSRTYGSPVLCMVWRNTKGYCPSGWILYYYIRCPRRPDPVEVARGVWSSHTSLGTSGENIPSTQPGNNLSPVRYLVVRATIQCVTWQLLMQVMCNLEVVDACWCVTY